MALTTARITVKPVGQCEARCHLVVRMDDEPIYETDFTIGDHDPADAADVVLEQAGMGEFTWASDTHLGGVHRTTDLVGVRTADIRTI